MRQHARWSSWGAYALLALAIAAATLAFAVLQAWDSPLIPGAAPGYRYLALGYQHAHGDDYASLDSSTLAKLLPRLPSAWRLGIGFAQHVALGVRPGKSLPRWNIALVYGDYLQALHLHPLAGRLIDLRDQQDGTPVIVLSATLARRWFVSAPAAVGRSVYDAHGLALRVIGVLPADFAGTDGLDSSKPTQGWIPGPLMTLISVGKWPFPKGKFPTGNLLSRMTMMGPAPLLSVPDAISRPQLRAQLALFYAQSVSVLPKDLTGLATAAPYSIFPTIQRQFAQRMRLFFGLAFATLILAAVNVLVLQWLRYLQRRGTLRLERVLGARRGYLLRRYAWSSLLVAAGLGIGALLLVALGALLLRHLASNLDAVLTVHALLRPLLGLLPPLVLLVALAQALPMFVLLARERLDSAQRVSGARGDRAFGSVLLAGEIALGALMSALAAWAIGYAWRSTHQDIGFLDRPATIVQVTPNGDIDALLVHMDPAKNRLQLQQALRLLAGVQALTPAGIGPAIQPNSGFDFPKTISAGTRSVSVCNEEVTPGWLQVSGVSIIAGQDFATAHAQPDTVLLDTRLAASLFGSAQAAVGRNVTDSGELKPQRVIGVVAPVYLHGTRRDGCPVLFADMRDNNFGLLGDPHSLIVGARLDGGQRAALRQRLTAFIAREHMGLAIRSIRGTTQTRDWLAAQQIAQSRVFTAIALFAWGIALSGIFALLRLYLAQRRRLLAIESALGATPSRTYLSVVLGTLAVAGIGAIIALLLVPWLATQYALLSGAQVVPYGAATWLALAVLLLAVFMVAHFPARRAARAEPAESLHEL
ncbi:MULTISPECIES: ABC transporter permease [Metallibacterium]|uniref:ABC transporter permease n=1 Tax=Metallibacterium TaxID=1218803 RepID=UPI00261DBD28|nr:MULTISPECIES: ABC transporter permease [Metallibacterium]